MIERITYLLAMVLLCLLPLAGMINIDSTDSNLLKHHLMVDDVLNEEYKMITADSPEVQEAYEKYKEIYGYASYAFERKINSEKDDKSEIKFDTYNPDTGDNIDAELTKEDIKSTLYTSETTTKDSKSDGTLGGSGSGSGGGSGRGSGGDTGEGNDLELSYQYEFVLPDDDDESNLDGGQSSGRPGGVIVTGDDDDGDDEPPEDVYKIGNLDTISQETANGFTTK